MRWAFRHERFAQKARQGHAARLPWLAPQINAVKLQQVESVEERLARVLSGNGRQRRSNSAFSQLQMRNHARFVAALVALVTTGAAIDTGLLQRLWLISYPRRWLRVCWRNP